MQIQYRQQFKKSSSRHDGNIKHNMTMKEEVPPREKVDSLKHIDPTNSRSFDDYFVRDYKTDQER